MLTLRNSTFLFLLLLATALSAWSIIKSNTHTPQVTLTNPDEPDSYMQDVVATVLNKQGIPVFKLASPKMTHYPENDMTQIETPHVTLFRKSPMPWYIDAHFAKTRHGIEEIIFSDHVNIHHPSDTTNPQTVLQTESLTIYPEKNIAETDQPVTFIQPDATVHGTGMLANLDLGTIQLLSKAQGEYAPTS